MKPIAILKSTLLKRILQLSLIGFLLFFIADHLWPLPLSHQQNPATTIVARDGTPLRVFADHQGVWRFKTNLTTVSPLYLQALINYEDQYFYYHPGVNPVAIIRATIQNFRA